MTSGLYSSIHSKFCDIVKSLMLSKLSLYISNMWGSEKYFQSASVAPHALLLWLSFWFGYGWCGQSKSTHDTHPQACQSIDSTFSSQPTSTRMTQKKPYKLYEFIFHLVLQLASVQFSSVTQLCPTLCDPMNRSTPGLPVHHQLPEFTQTHVHRVGDAIQPSHPLSSPSPPAPNPSHHQSLFQWINSSHEVAKVLEFQL